ncbi:hypothetical protein ABPG74_013482 [Tetrahymena malaccensis]
MIQFVLYSITFFIGFLTLCYFQFKRSKNLKPLKNGIMVVFGSGGHTGEMLSLIKKINFKEFNRVYFVKAFSDNVSQGKVEDFLKKNKVEINNEKIEWIDIPRSRQVKQSFASSIITTVSSIIYCFIIVIKIKQIDILLCNGPGLCLPIVVSVLMNKYLMLYRRSKIIFVESWCRVQTLSLTGKILIKFVDKFLVQWEELVQLNPKIEYIGQLI